MTKNKTLPSGWNTLERGLITLFLVVLSAQIFVSVSFYFRLSIIGIFYYGFLVGNLVAIMCVYILKRILRFKKFRKLTINQGRVYYRILTVIVLFFINLEFKHIFTKNFDYETYYADLEFFELIILVIVMIICPIITVLVKINLDKIEINEGEIKQDDPTHLIAFKEDQIEVKEKGNFFYYKLIYRIGYFLIIGYLTIDTIFHDPEIVNYNSISNIYAIFAPVFLMGLIIFLILLYYRWLKPVSIIFTREFLTFNKKNPISWQHFDIIKVKIQGIGTSTWIASLSSMLQIKETTSMFSLVRIKLKGPKPYKFKKKIKLRIFNKMVLRDFVSALLKFSRENHKNLKLNKGAKVYYGLRTSAKQKIMHLVLLILIFIVFFFYFLYVVIICITGRFFIQNPYALVLQCAYLELIILFFILKKLQKKKLQAIPWVEYINYETEIKTEEFKAQSEKDLEAEFKTKNIVEIQEEKDFDEEWEF